MKPWSYSTLVRYETCPRQFYEVKVAKNFVEEESVHQIWGKNVHTAFENYIKGGGKPKASLPDTMKQWEGVVDKVLALPATVHTEVPIALDANFVSAPWDSCWTRGVIDVMALGDTTAIVIDWKTGKRKQTEQLKLYAAYVFAVYPQVNEVETGLVWLQPRTIDTERIKRDEAPIIWRDFVERAARLESAYERDSWPERPSGLCNGWCPVSTCKYYRAKV